MSHLRDALPQGRHRKILVCRSNMNSFTDLSPRKQHICRRKNKWKILYLKVLWEYKGLSKIIWNDVTFTAEMLRNQKTMITLLTYSLIASRNARFSRLLMAEVGTKAQNIPYKWQHTSMAKCQDTKVYEVKPSFPFNSTILDEEKMVVWQIEF